MSSFKDWAITMENNITDCFEHYDRNYNSSMNFNTNNSKSFDKDYQKSYRTNGDVQQRQVVESLREVY
jgi:hypothetical protein